LIQNNNNNNNNTRSITIVRSCSGILGGHNLGVLFNDNVVRQFEQVDNRFCVLAKPFFFFFLTLSNKKKNEPKKKKKKKVNSGFNGKRNNGTR